MFAKRLDLTRVQLKEWPSYWNHAEGVVEDPGLLTCGVRVVKKSKYKTGQLVVGNQTPRLRSELDILHSQLKNNSEFGDTQPQGCDQ